jgi:predicted nuclease of predicted toxin-antitoxin system
MKVLIDMNLPPVWVPFLMGHGIDALHWSTVGDPRAADSELMSWALNAGCIVFTHDLDMGHLLASTGALGPSVIQVRTLDVTPQAIGEAVVQVLQQHVEDLELGAIVSLDPASARVRLLPIRRRQGPA